MYFNKINLKLKKPIFKKRHNLKLKIFYKCKFKKIIFFKKTNFLELNFLKKKITKLLRLVKKKKIIVYINLKKNHLLTKKSKNSRMGKGKGKFMRYISRLKIGLPILTYNVYSNFRLC